MLSHESVWTAIDRLASGHGLSASGLARRAGLDPTTFNPSKRTAPDGRPRWPSMESVSKILAATGASFSEFVDLLDHPADRLPIPSDLRRASDILPLPGDMSNADPLAHGASGFFHDGGYPEQTDWPAAGPDVPARDTAIRVSGDALLPLYRDGDIVVVSPAARIRKGDRVMLRLADGALLAHVFERRTSARIHVRSLLEDREIVSFSQPDVDWVARIIWASQ
ncbi:helix-turn-helix transcriptional regulator [Stappia sp. ES.058]|uniref:S24 family peptidase n=1 Tax=Stappia sp. ES.058 TaxID=1881061 RepID=UPI00087B50BA|nr:helix-turn-helix transcriptional regulator [Stappia sp. ES.058]SDT93754.1 Phage repressor protein C, contains Cro/C1-type HTH and peptisase s24 domains [Stappia sp. ES.058]